MHEPLQQPISASQREVVRALKNADHGGCARHRIEIRRETGEYLGSLTPITEREAQDARICASLSRWRRMFKKNFLTQFEPTSERTQRWLAHVVLPDDTRILFLIRDQDDRPIGNFGVCHIVAKRAELDNLIRGEKGGDARLAFFAEIALLAWSFTELEVSTACLHVFSTNGRTIILHQSVGFVERARSPLWQVESDGDICLTTATALQAQPTGIDLVRMELTREEFDARHAWSHSVAKGGLWTR